MDCIEENSLSEMPNEKIIEKITLHATLNNNNNVSASGSGKGGSGKKEDEKITSAVLKVLEGYKFELVPQPAK